MIRVYKIKYVGVAFKADLKKKFILTLQYGLSCNLGWVGQPKPSSLEPSNPKLKAQVVGFQVQVRLRPENQNSI